MRIKVRTLVKGSDNIQFSGESEFYYTDRELVEQGLEGLIASSCSKERAAARSAFPSANDITVKCIGHYERSGDAHDV